MTKYLAISLLLIYGCSQSTKNLAETFIVPHDTMPISKAMGTQPPPPPPIKTYYLPSIFIVDTGDVIFFYQQEQYRWTCGTGIQWDTPPEFINLKPKDIIQLSSDNIDQFIVLNIGRLDQEYRSVAIASTVDTLKSAGLSKIITTFKDTTNHIKWIFRKVTQEESVVLDYKKRKAKYYSEDVKWDSTKIRFIPSSSDMIKFSPPKIVDE